MSNYFSVSRVFQCGFLLTAVILLGDLQRVLGRRGGDDGPASDTSRDDNVCVDGAGSAHKIS